MTLIVGLLAPTLLKGDFELPPMQLHDDATSAAEHGRDPAFHEDGTSAAGDESGGLVREGRSEKHRGHFFNIEPFGRID